MDPAACLTSKQHKGCLYFSIFCLNNEFSWVILFILCLGFMGSSLALRNLVLLGHWSPVLLKNKHGNVTLHFSPVENGQDEEGFGMNLPRTWNNVSARVRKLFTNLPAHFLSGPMLMNKCSIVLRSPACCWMLCDRCCLWLDGPFVSSAWAGRLGASCTACQDSPLCSGVMSWVLSVLWLGLEAPLGHRQLSAF